MGLNREDAPVIQQGRVLAETGARPPPRRPLGRRDHLVLVPGRSAPPAAPASRRPAGPTAQAAGEFRHLRRPAPCAMIWWPKHTPIMGRSAAWIRRISASSGGSRGDPRRRPWREPVTSQPSRRVGLSGKSAVHHRPGAETRIRARSGRALDMKGIVRPSQAGFQPGAWPVCKMPIFMEHRGLIKLEGSGAALRLQGGQTASR